MVAGMNVQILPRLKLYPMRGYWLLCGKLFPHSNSTLHTSGPNEQQMVSRKEGRKEARVAG